MNTQTNSCSTLTLVDDLALYCATGADAAQFLHGQLSNDVTGLAADHAALAGYCSPKGRLLATTLYWHGPANDQPAIYLLMKSDLAQAVMRRLGMFILRSKVSLAPVQQTVVGVQTGTNSTDLPIQPPSHAGQAWACTHKADGTWIQLPAANEQTRWLWLPSQTAENLAPLANAQATQNWQAADILAGLPWVQAETQDIFIPQTLNLDLINGVSFTKGCYPGQEVVARAHYRGTVKRRMFCGYAPVDNLANAVTAGSDIYKENDENPCGRVANVARQTSATDQRLVLLMELPVADAQATNLRLASPDGPAITLLPLPYQLPA